MNNTLILVMIPDDDGCVSYFIKQYLATFNNSTLENPHILFIIKEPTRHTRRVLRKELLITKGNFKVNKFYRGVHGKCNISLFISEKNSKHSDTLNWLLTVHLNGEYFDKFLIIEEKVLIPTVVVDLLKQHIKPNRWGASFVPVKEVSHLKMRSSITEEAVYHNFIVKLININYNTDHIFSIFSDKQYKFQDYRVLLCSGDFISEIDGLKPRTDTGYIGQLLSSSLNTTLERVFTHIIHGYSYKERT